MAALFPDTDPRCRRCRSRRRCAAYRSRGTPDNGDRTGQGPDIYAFATDATGGADMSTDHGEGPPAPAPEGAGERSPRHRGPPIHPYPACKVSDVNVEAPPGQTAQRATGSTVAQADTPSPPRPQTCSSCRGQGGTPLRCADHTSDLAGSHAMAKMRRAGAKRAPRQPPAAHRRTSSSKCRCRVRPTMPREGHCRRFRGARAIVSVWAPWNRRVGIAWTRGR